jgi:hypothetical protein
MTGRAQMVRFCDRAELSWEARTFEIPAGAALFAGALALASQLAGCTGAGGGRALTDARDACSPPPAKPSGPRPGASPATALACERAGPGRGPAGLWDAEI